MRLQTLSDTFSQEVLSQLGLCHDYGDCLDFAVAMAIVLSQFYESSDIGIQMLVRVYESDSQRIDLVHARAYLDDLEVDVLDEDNDITESEWSLSDWADQLEKQAEQERDLADEFDETTDNSDLQCHENEDDLGMLVIQSMTLPELLQTRFTHLKKLFEHSKKNYNQSKALLDLEHVESIKGTLTEIAAQNDIFSNPAQPLNP